jgi:hypothetical protein
LNNITKENAVEELWPILPDYIKVSLSETFNITIHEVRDIFSYYINDSHSDETLKSGLEISTHIIWAEFTTYICGYMRGLRGESWRKVK